jgi:1-acyl-sn-glycerol-3-phosphate acyltransferase
VPTVSQLSSSSPVLNKKLQETSLINVSTGIDDRSENEIYKNPFVIPREEINAILSLKKGEKEKIVNPFGVLVSLVSVITCPIWLAAMMVLEMVNKANEDFDPNRAIYDFTGKIWSRAFLWLSMSYPDLSGDLKFIKEHDGPCLFVANHASWLDIPVVCTVLDPVFKFISKGDLAKVPCIGHQLKGGKHILIDRDDRRSQLRTFKEGVGWLKKGVPLMAFPEGKRSEDGRLMEFKGGLFSMAVKCNVPIIPISISNTHAVMPSYSLFPVQHGAGKLSVHIHSPIHVEGKTDAELSELVREAIISKIPIDQRPVPPLDEIIDNVLEEEKSNKERVAAKV